MSNTLRYILTILIWGSTWLAIQYQVDSVNPIWAVSYRFGLAAILLFGLCKLRKIPLGFSLTQHRQIIFQSLFMFSLAYIFYYMGSVHLNSGYIAILGASVVIMNIFNGRLFLGIPLSRQAIIGALLGIIGLCIVFAQELTSLHSGAIHLKTLIIAILLTLLGNFMGSIGNIISKSNQNHHIPIFASNAWGMLYGSLFTALIALVTGHMPTFSFAPSFLFSLFYLSILGSIIAFEFYLRLIGELGPDKAAYVFVITPIIALVWSSFFEAFQWQLSTFMGISLILIGNSIMMHKPSNKKRVST